MADESNFRLRGILMAQQFLLEHLWAEVFELRQESPEGVLEQGKELLLQFRQMPQGEPHASQAMIVAEGAAHIENVWAGVLQRLHSVERASENMERKQG